MSIFLVLLFAGCKLNLEGDKITVYFMGKDIESYNFETLEDIRDSIKYMIDDLTGQVPLNKKLENKFDELTASFKYNPERHNEVPSYYYPDFTDLPYNYIVIPYGYVHNVSNNGYVRKYYETLGLYIFEYDRVNEICSESVVLDTGYDY